MSGARRRFSFVFSFFSCTLAPLKIREWHNLEEIVRSTLSSAKLIRGTVRDIRTLHKLVVRDPYFIRIFRFNALSLGNDIEARGIKDIGHNEVLRRIAQYSWRLGSQSAHVRGDERDGGTRLLPGEYLYPSPSITLAGNKSGIVFAAWPPE